MMAVNENSLKRNHKSVMIFSIHIFFSFCVLTIVTFSSTGPLFSGESFSFRVMRSKFSFFITCEILNVDAEPAVESMKVADVNDYYFECS